MKRIFRNLARRVLLTLSTAGLTALVIALGLAALAAAGRDPDGRMLLARDPDPTGLAQGTHTGPAILRAGDIVLSVPRRYFGFDGPHEAAGEGVIDRASDGGTDGLAARGEDGDRGQDRLALIVTVPDFAAARAPARPSASRRSGSFEAIAWPGARPGTWPGASERGGAGADPATIPPARILRISIALEPPGLSADRAGQRSAAAIGSYSNGAACLESGRFTVPCRGTIEVGFGGRLAFEVVATPGHGAGLADRLTDWLTQAPLSLPSLVGFQTTGNFFAGAGSEQNS